MAPNVPLFLPMLLQDLHYAARGLRQNLTFTIVAALSLAIGIGANTAIFTLLDQLLLRPLPVPEPHRLIQIDLPGPRQGEHWGPRAFSNPMFRDLQAPVPSLSAVTAQFSGSASLSTGNASQIVQATLVAGNWFSTFGLTTALGRPISPDDDRTVDGHPVVVLTHPFWQRRFGSDPAIVNKKILLNGQPMLVVGVAQPGFRGTDLANPTDLFLPLAMQRMLMPNSPRLQDRQLYFLQLFARLAPNATLDHARSDLDRLLAPVLLEELKLYRNMDDSRRTRFLARRVRLESASRGNLASREQVSTVMWLLTALVAGVLLIACANVANLLLARSTARRKEIAVRLALGASRWQLIRLVLAESLLLSLIGGALGLLAANWAADALIAFTNPAGSQQLVLETTPDLRIVLFTLALSVLTGLAFGLAPAFAATRPDVAPTLKDEAGALSAGGASAWLRKSLVVVQVAMSLLLLAAASLFLTTLHNLRNHNPGFDADHLLAFTIRPSLNGYQRAAAVALTEKLTAALEALPAVNEVSMAAEPLLSNSFSQSTMTVEGYQHGPEEDMNPLTNDVGPGFFHTLRVPLLKGRDFTPADNASAPKVAIISETFANMYFKGRDPIGYKVGFRRERVPDHTIVGVIREVQHADLRDDKGRRQVYFPSAQARAIDSRTFYLRTSSPLESLAPAIRALVRKEDPALAIDEMRTMRDQIDVSLTLERLISLLCTAFGAIATLLAAIGLYGIMAFHVARRTREIGIRMALGAQRADVHKLVLKEAAVLAAAGVAVGIPLALVLSRYTTTLLFQIHPNHPSIYVGTAIFLLLVALAASLLPARRATRIDPISTLRQS